MTSRSNFITSLDRIAGLFEVGIKKAVFLNRWVAGALFSTKIVVLRGSLNCIVLLQVCF